MKIKYNAPTTLTYAFFCTLVVGIDQFLFHGLTRAFFTVPGAPNFNPLEPINYLRLFTHIAGHADWNHLISNMAYVLLLGPMLEETYGSLTMFLMTVVTGFVTGVINSCFFPHPLLGASGVVFMMILLASFTNSGKDDIPLTFILIMILYLGREILNAFRGDDISQFAHLAGGLCGSLFGFFKPARNVRVIRKTVIACPPADVPAGKSSPRRAPAASTASAETNLSSRAGGDRSASGARSAAGTRSAVGTKSAPVAPAPRAAAKKATIRLPESKYPTGKPATGKPATGKPSTSKPSTGKPQETGKPTAGKPSATGKVSAAKTPAKPRSRG